MTETPIFASDALGNETELSGYTTVSRAAVLALVLGLLSVGALATRLLWFLPITGVLLAAIALRAIQHYDELTGRRAAVLGLILSLLFGIWAPSRYFSRQYYLSSQAQKFANEWLELVQDGERQQAHQLHLPQSSRVRPGGSIQQYYELSFEARDDLDSLFQDLPLKAVLEHGRQGQLEQTGRPRIERARFMDRITVPFRYQYQEDGRQKSVDITILMVRVWDLSSGDYQWNVEEIS